MTCENQTLAYFLPLIRQAEDEVVTAAAYEVSQQVRMARTHTNDTWASTGVIERCPVVGGEREPVIAKAPRSSRNRNAHQTEHRAHLERKPFSGQLFICCSPLVLSGGC